LNHYFIANIITSVPTVLFVGDNTNEGGRREIVGDNTNNGAVGENTNNGRQHAQH